MRWLCIHAALASQRRRMHRGRSAGHEARGHPAGGKTWRKGAGERARQHANTGSERESERERHTHMHMHTHTHTHTHEHAHTRTRTNQGELRDCCGHAVGLIEEASVMHGVEKQGAAMLCLCQHARVELSHDLCYAKDRRRNSHEPQVVTMRRCEGNAANLLRKCSRVVAHSMLEPQRVFGAHQRLRRRCWCCGSLRLKRCTANGRCCRLHRPRRSKSSSWCSSG